ncbi:MAG: AAA family ATPase [Spirochaetales bacterium]|nr:AAA family ATPase [Spirochaetales bacterium]
MKEKLKQIDDLTCLGEEYEVLYNPEDKWTDHEHMLPGVRRGEIAVLAAAGASGKSYLSQIFGMAIASGEPVFSFLPKRSQPRSVVYFQFEDLWVDLYNRGNEILRAYPQMDISPTRMMFQSFAVPGMTLGLVGEGGVDWDLEEKLKKLWRGKDLVILDPLTNIWSGCDENDQGAVMVLMNSLRRIARESKSAILICHHVNKGALLNKTTSEASAVRGSGAIVNSPRCVMTMATGQSSYETVITWVKLNNHAPISPVTLYRGHKGVLYEDSRQAERSRMAGKSLPVCIDIRCSSTTPF